MPTTTTTTPLESAIGMSTLQRPRFGAGLLLEAEDLTAGVDYTRGLMRLMFRSLFGCGVICGLEVTAKLTCQRKKLEVRVAKGLALDGAGNPIEVATETTLTYDPDCNKPMPPVVWVAVCYLEKCCRPKDVACSPDDDASVLQTRSHDAFTIHIYEEQPACACACAPPVPPGPTNNCRCYADHNAHKCKCDCGCTCVLLAKIDTKMVDKGDQAQPRFVDIGTVAGTDDVSMQATTDEVRFIRPLQVGFLPCLKQLP